jgi:hypothetical protein
VVIATWADDGSSLPDPEEPTRDFTGLASVLAAQEVSIAREARYRDLPADARSPAGRVSAPLVLAPPRALSRVSCPTRPVASRSADGAVRRAPSPPRRRARPGAVSRVGRRIGGALLLLALLLALALLGRAAVTHRLAWDCPGCADGRAEPGSSGKPPAPVWRDQAVPASEP